MISQLLTENLNNMTQNCLFFGGQCPKLKVSYVWCKFYYL